VVEERQAAAFVCRLRELDGIDVVPSRSSLDRRNGTARRSSLSEALACSQSAGATSGHNNEQRRAQNTALPQALEQELC
jgi:hypothetical protein